MNAYELADALLKNLTMEYDCDKYMEEAANMLRHQADYIKHLERGLESSIALNKAQVERLTKLSKNVDELEEELLKAPQIKELSDEEIIEVFEKPFHKEPTGKINDEVIAFAKAILKKASEK